MSTEVVKPYAPPTPENFDEAFPEVAAAVKEPATISNRSELGPVSAGLASPRKGIRNLDQISQQNLDAARRALRRNPPMRATIVNLHPWPLYFEAGNYYVRGIRVPACEPGQDFACTHVRNAVIERDMNEDGTWKYLAITPIRRAGQFLKEFGEAELYGGGVIIFEGESSPEKLIKDHAKIETYQPDGRLNVDIVAGYEIDDEGHKIPADVETPVRRVFVELLDEARRLRNERYLIKVQWADQMYKSTRAGDRNLITQQHRLMAEVLHAEGILPTVPEWNLSSKMELGLAEEVCKACGANPRKGACMCPNGHVLNALEAYREALIEYDHVSMERMTAEEWEEADRIKAERDQVRAKRGAAVKPSGKGKSKSEAKAD